MEDIKKPDLSISWAQEGGVIEPDEDKVKLGWIGEVPLAQWQNWWQLRADKSLNYVLQKGIPEWDENTFYIEDKSFVQYNGEVYVCKWTGRGQRPSNNPTRWSRLQDYLNLDAKVDIDALPNILSPKADKSTTITGVGALTGGGDLSANRTLDLTSAAKDSLQKANTSVQPSRKVVAGTGLEGGGDLSADRTLSVKFGTTAGTVTQGNDSRLSNAREWTASTVSQSEAEAGTSTTRRAWTAQRVRQAIVGWFNSASGTIGRTIFGRNTAAQVRGDLGLGSAATRDVGTSSDNVMEVGAFGLGGSLTGKRARPDDVYRNIQFVGTGDSSRTHQGLPVQYCNNLVMVYSPTGDFTALQQNITNASLSLSGIRDGVPIEQRIVIDSRNLLSSTGSSTQFPMNQKAVTDALNTKANTSTQVIAGTGLSGGGNLSANRTLSVKYGTSAGTAAQGNDSRIVNALQRGNNLSDVTNPATARGNLGLGTAATRNVGTSSGNVMEVGAFGLGSTSLGSTGIPTVTSRVGFYADSTSGWAGVNVQSNQQYGFALYSQGHAENLRFKAYGNGEEFPNREILHTGNILKSTGNNNEFPMSQKAVTDALNTKANVSNPGSMGIGVGQTWRDVKGSRSSGTTYTNTTGRAIAVSLQGDAATVQVTVGGVVIKRKESGDDYAFFIVPNGDTYSVLCNKLKDWAELR